MKINGILLREALKRWERARTLAIASFQDSLWRFDGEQKPSPMEACEAFIKADTIHATLQDLQQRYNSAIEMEHLGNTITLGVAVKMIGGAGRVEKMWTEAAAKPKNRYGFDDSMDRKRDKDAIYAIRSISVQDCVAISNKTSEIAAKLRSQIALANATMLDLDHPTFHNTQGQPIATEESLREWLAVSV